eukprot:GGOE01056643.1.p1 GENE.GGOE01056643.1~~GGOE01056643.1.p1  ORF type:complete len:707 (+),score=78.31 GGOE01056643.1:85-2205(+)
MEARRQYVQKGLFADHHPTCHAAAERNGVQSPSCTQWQSPRRGKAQLYDALFSPPVSDSLIAWVTRAKALVAARHLQDKIIHGEVQTSILKKALRRTDPRFQGDAEMILPENVRKRALLSSAEEIRTEIEHIWRRLPRRGNKLQKEVYLGYSRRLFQRLMAKNNMAVSTHEMATTLRSDWKCDSGGKGWMDYTDFEGAMFNLADLWVNTVDVADYVRFLRGCHQLMGEPMLLGVAGARMSPRCRRQPNRHQRRRPRQRSQSPNHRSVGSPRSDQQCAGEGKTGPVDDAPTAPNPLPAALSVEAPNEATLERAAFSIRLRRLQSPSRLCSPELSPSTSALRSCSDLLVQSETSEWGSGVWPRVGGRPFSDSGSLSNAHHMATAEEAQSGQAGFTGTAWSSIMTVTSQRLKAGQFTSPTGGTATQAAVGRSDEFGLARHPTSDHLIPTLLSSISIDDMLAEMQDRTAASTAGWEVHQPEVPAVSQMATGDDGSCPAPQTSQAVSVPSRDPTEAIPAGEEATGPAPHTSSGTLAAGELDTAQPNDDVVTVEDLTSQPLLGDGGMAEYNFCEDPLPDQASTSRRRWCGVDELAAGCGLGGYCVALQWDERQVDCEGRSSKTFTQSLCRSNGGHRSPLPRGRLRKGSSPRGDRALAHVVEFQRLARLSRLLRGRSLDAEQSTSAGSAFRAAQTSRRWGAMQMRSVARDSGL